jgi:hypothetical protein
MIIIIFRWEFRNVCLILQLCEEVSTPFYPPVEGLDLLGDEIDVNWDGHKAGAQL